MFFIWLSHDRSLCMPNKFPFVSVIHMGEINGNFPTILFNNCSVKAHACINFFLLPPSYTQQQLLIPSHSPTFFSPLSHSLSLMARFSFFCLLLLLGCIVSSAQEDVAPESSRNGRELVPAMFVFGDSLIDNGNNNDLPSLAKANYYPYGIDFSNGPTGRFSNGYTIVDEIGDRPPSFSLLLILLISFLNETGEMGDEFGKNDVSASLAPLMHWCTDAVFIKFPYFVCFCFLATILLQVLGAEMTALFPS